MYIWSWAWLCTPVTWEEDKGRWGVQTSLGQMRLKSPQTRPLAGSCCDWVLDYRPILDKVCIWQGDTIICYLWILNIFNTKTVCPGFRKTILKPESLILLGNQVTLPISREGSLLKINPMFAFSWNISRKQVQTTQIAIILKKKKLHRALLACFLIVIFITSFLKSPCYLYQGHKWLFLSQN